MNKKQLASKLMFIGGIAELVVALLHFLMPFQLATAGEIVELSHDYRGFLLLATFAIGLCMVIFGGLSIYFSNKLLLGEESAWIFGLSQGILWAGRTIFELILPVTDCSKTNVGSSYVAMANLRHRYRTTAEPATSEYVEGLPV